MLGNKRQAFGQPGTAQEQFEDPKAKRKKMQYVVEIRRTLSLSANHSREWLPFALPY